MTQIQIGPRTPGRVIARCMIRHRAETILLIVILTVYLTIIGAAAAWSFG